VVYTHIIQSDEEAKTTITQQPKTKRKLDNLSTADRHTY